MKQLIKKLELKLWPYITLNAIVYGGVFLFALWYFGWIK